MYIYAGAGTGGTLLGTYNGTGTINYSGAAGQTLTVRFTSDGSVTYSGLNASVSYSGNCWVNGTGGIGGGGNGESTAGTANTGGGGGAERAGGSGIVIVRYPKGRNNFV